MPRKYLVTGEERPRDEKGAFVELPAERKNEVLAAVKPMLMAGATLPEIAAHFGIASRTLDYWLAQLGDEYKEIRRQWVDIKLAAAEEKMETAPDPFQLAKGRELFRAASWYAERRDPERYADKRELTVKSDEPQTPEQVRERIRQLEERLGIRTIQHEQNENEPA